MFKKLILSILAGLYLAAINIRHKLFDWGILKSVKYDIPIICIGNITVGGTGKTPMAEMIVSYFLKSHKIALLSRGYGRKTKGYIEVNTDSHYRNVGDEPLQMKLKFPECIVVVCENRRSGIETIRRKHPDVNLIIMDDGFQHRYVEPKVNIVMVDATRPPHDDKMLPLGTLRDTLGSLYRANYFIVTKCPANISALDKLIMRKVLAPAPFQSLYFTRIESFKPTPIFPEEAIQDVKLGGRVIALAGIGNPAPFISALESSYNLVGKLLYNDHHIYKIKDLKNIATKLKRYPDAVIITTEKDAVKMASSSKIPAKVRERIYYIPINISFVDDPKIDFLKKLQNDIITN